MATSKDTMENIPKWKLARQGIQLLINNKANDAVALFKQNPDCIQLYAGYSFAVFMDALMTLEEDKLNTALNALKETERRCYADNGWLKMMKSKMFGSEISLDDLECQIILADAQVCMAILIFLQQDMSGIIKGGWILRKSWKIYQHTYNSIRSLYLDIVGELPDAAKQNLVLPQLDEDEDGNTEDSEPWDYPTFSLSTPSNGYLNSDPYSLQKMTHSHTGDSLSNYSAKFENSDLYNCSFNNNCKSSTRCNSDNCLKNNCCNDNNNKSVQLAHSKNDYANLFKRNFFIRKSCSVNGTLSKLDKKSFPYSSSLHIFTQEKPKTYNIDKETITRLMGAISFGYGLFHLGISLLPPSLLRITSFLGFGGNRNLGINNLMYARQGTDMRAPLATLSLLWYHTIVRPFYAIDGSNVQAGVEAASQLLNESQYEYKNSALFLFFKGRVHRLNSNIKEALSDFQASVENSNQREIKILALHEVGWCHLIELDYQSAEHTFDKLRHSSRWSRAFYAYLSIICAGACSSNKSFDKLIQMKKFFENTPKHNQLSTYLLRRFALFPFGNEKKKKNKIFWALMVYELLYLWNTLPSCSFTSIQQIILDCENMTVEPMLGISLLIKGSCYCILNEYDHGISCFRKCLELRKGLPLNAEDAHVSAFAQYELGQILIKHLKTKEEGKLLLADTVRYKDYDFEQRLDVRVHSLAKLD